MASGDTLFILSPIDGRRIVTGVAAATLDRRGEVECLDFADSTVEVIEWDEVMPGAYANGGTRVLIYWASTSAAAGQSARFGVFWRAIKEDSVDLDDLPSVTFNEIAAVEATNSGQISIAPITFTDGADMGSVVAADMFTFRLRRQPAHATDTLVGDAEVFFVVVTET